MAPTADSSDRRRPSPPAKTPDQPAPGTDSRVEDWFGQSVERDAELADRLTSDLGEPDAEAAFDAQSSGRNEQDARHGDHVDPDQE